MRKLAMGEIDLVLKAIPSIPKTGFGREVAERLLRKGKYKQFIWVLLDTQKQNKRNLEYVDKLSRNTIEIKQENIKLGQEEK